MMALNNRDNGRFVLYLAVCVFACSSAFAQADGKPAILSGQSQTNGTETTLKGCLVGDLFITIDGDYVLTGDTSALSKYVETDISIQGTKDDSTKPWPSFTVTRIKEIFERPSPRLSPSFSDPSNWQTERNQAYEIQYAHPANLPRVPASESGIETNLVATDGAVALGGFGIPREVYPETNFVGGGFQLFVNPEITNRESCEQFGHSDLERPTSSQTVSGIQYAVTTWGSAAAGTAYDTRYFHTFQNGFCYELVLELAMFSTDSTSGGCTTPELREPDRLKLIEPLVSRVSFFRPTARTARVRNPQATPSVTSFVASSKTARGDLATSPPIIFSWSSQDTDYVEFTYSCSNPDASSGDVAILEAGGVRYCQDSSQIKSGYSTDHFNRSPNSSIGIQFGNRQKTPIPIIVTITPFSYAVAYPNASQSLTVTVDPQNSEGR